ncbi:hypothetical protein [Flagellimonas sp. S3867]|nr:hypothetical protein [Flagellimonas sp. S3867]
MEYYGNSREMNKNKFKMVNVEEDFTMLMNRIKSHIEESKSDWIICLN